MTESRAASAGRRLERHNGFHSSANSGGTQAAGAGARPRHDTGLERGRTTRAKGGGGGGRRSVVGEGKGREGGRCGQRMKWGSARRPWRLVRFSHRGRAFPGKKNNVFHHQATGCQKKKNKLNERRSDEEKKRKKKKGKKKCQEW